MGESRIRPGVFNGHCGFDRRRSANNSTHTIAPALGNLHPHLDHGAARGRWSWLPPSVLASMLAWRMWQLLWGPPNVVLQRHRQGACAMLRPVCRVSATVTGTTFIPSSRCNKHTHPHAPCMCLRRLTRALQHHRRRPHGHHYLPLRSRCALGSHFFLPYDDRSRLTHVSWKPLGLKKICLALRAPRVPILYLTGSKRKLKP